MKANKGYASEYVFTIYSIISHAEKTHVQQSPEANILSLFLQLMRPEMDDGQWGVDKELMLKILSKKQ